MEPLDQYHVITVVWGEKYTTAFVEVVLPTLMARGNLPAFADNGVRARYRIFTLEADAHRLRQSRQFRKLAEIMPVEIVGIDDLKPPLHPYVDSAECHRRAIAAAESASAAMVFLPPDTVWSNGAIARVLDAANAGKRAVMIPGISVVSETFVPALRAQAHASGGPAMAVEGRALAGLAIEHLHPRSQAFFTNSDHFARWPSNLYWNVNDRGFVGRCFHLHPLMIAPTQTGARPCSTIDDDYVWIACPDWRNSCLITNSDEIIGCEMSAGGYLADAPPNRASAFETAVWARSHTNALHRSFFTNACFRIHSGDLDTSRDAARWVQAEREAEQFVRRVNHWLSYGSLPVGLTVSLRKLAGKGRRLRQLLSDRLKRDHG